MQFLAVSGPRICANNYRHGQQCVTYVSWVEIASVFSTLVGHRQNYFKNSLYPDVLRL